MALLLDPRQRYIRHAALGLLLVGALAAGCAALLHRLQGSTDPLDRWVPLLLSMVLALLALRVWRQPGSLEQCFWLALGTALAALLAPVYWRIAEAAAAPGVRLVDTLPPIGATLVPLVLVMIAFLRARAALWSALVAWLLLAAPILCWLLLHPAELQTPRGRELLITLGPVMVLLLLFIPFQRGMQQRLAGLTLERARLQALAERDTLTGLYNRRAGESFLQALVGAKDQDLELALFDIDRFKSINDQHGHPAGDRVLHQIAARCQARLRRDDIVARWGGEEFLLLTRASPDEPVGRIAEALRLAIAAEPIEPVGRVTASFGVTRMAPGDSMATLLQRADEALYEAKRGGRDRVVSR